MNVALADIPPMMIVHNPTLQLDTFKAIVANKQALSHHQHAVRLALRRERDDEYYREFKHSRRHFVAAHMLYCEARHHYAKQRKRSAPDDPARTHNHDRYAFTRGLHGMLLFEMEGLCSLSLGSRSYGLRGIAKANAALTFSENQEWRAQTLVNLMRASGPLARLKQLPRALSLTGQQAETSDSRKQVLSALMGNRFYNWLALRDLDVTDAQVAQYEAQG